MDIRDRRILLHGDKGVGKTTLARSLHPEVVVLAVDQDRGGDLCFTGKDAWVKFKAASTQVVDMPADKKPLLVIEDTELAFQCCRRTVLDQHQWRVETDAEPRGVGYELVKRQWMEWLQTLLKGGGFVLLAQTQLREYTTWTRHFHRQEPVVTNMALERIVPHLDVMGQVAYRTGDDTGDTQRVLRLGGREDRAMTGPMVEIQMRDVRACITALTQH